MSEDKDWIVCSCDFCGADFVIYKDTGKKEYLIVTGDNRDKIIRNGRKYGKNNI